MARFIKNQVKVSIEYRFSDQIVPNSRTQSTAKSDQSANSLSSYETNRQRNKMKTYVVAWPASLCPYKGIILAVLLASTRKVIFEIMKMEIWHVKKIRKFAMRFQICNYNSARAQFIRNSRPFSRHFFSKFHELLFAIFWEPKLCSGFY